MKSNFFDRPQYTSPFMSQTLSSCHESIKDIIIIIISAFGKKKKQPTILMIDEITIQTRGLKTFHYDVKTERNDDGETTPSVLIFIPYKSRFHHLSAAWTRFSR